MLKIGITGGIGSGKSTVCKIFETIGVPVFYADVESKNILFNDALVITEVKNLLGNEVFTDGKPDRKKIAAAVFDAPEKLQSLNAILHPAVLNKSEAWFHSQKEKPYALKEAALIFETHGEKNLDNVIVVSAPEALRIKRIMHRDGISEVEVMARMKNQIPQEEKDAMADFIIFNDESQLLIPQVLKCHKSIIRISTGE